MIPKISLTAAFLLLIAPPMACASNFNATNPAPITVHANALRPAIVIAQDDQSSVGTSTNDNDNSDSNDNDSDSNDDSDNNQNDGNQADQNNNGEEQAIPPQVLNGDNNSNEAPQMNNFPQSEPMNPQ
jgi:hypothetical protein